MNSKIGRRTFRSCWQPVAYTDSCTPIRVDNLPVKVLAAQNIELDDEYLDPCYTVVKSQVSQATKSNLVTLFKVVPNCASLPGFVGRWDKQTVDVDPDPLGCIDRDTWKDEKNGYRGHHTQELTKDPRVYQIDLHIPNRPIFKARCRLNIKHGVQFNATLIVSAY